MTMVKVNVTFMVKEANQTKLEKVTTSVTQKAYILGKNNGNHESLEVWAKELFPIATEAHVIKMEEV